MIPEQAQEAWEAEGKRRMEMTDSERALWLSDKLAGNEYVQEAAVLLRKLAGGHSRGYAAGLKAAAEVCRKTGDTFGKGNHQTGAYVCQQKISYLPIDGEAEGSGPCVVVPPLAWEGFKSLVLAKCGKPTNRDKTPAELIEMARAMLAAAKAEHEEKARK